MAKIVTNSAFLILSVMLYLLLGYFIERHDTSLLLSVYLLLFGLYLWSVSKWKENWKWYLAAAFIFRLVFIVAEPSLSEDVYRFIWDGRMWYNGINPFHELPREIVIQGISGLNMELFQYLNSPDYYTIYPPFAQLLFFLSVWLSPDSILGSMIVLRVYLLLGELFTVLLLCRVLQHYGKPKTLALIYALNPLVILEISANFHFEGLLILFLLVGILMLERSELLRAGVGFGLAIATKLLPLILLPTLIKRYSMKQLLLFFSAVIVIGALSFYPFLDATFIEGFQSSFELYFRKFEFNASIYYLVREFGFWWKGYNIIGSSGPWMAGATFFSIIAYSAIAKRTVPITRLFLWPWMIYLMFATTVHPWYVIPLFLLACLEGYVFGIIWTALVFLTYSGYTETGYLESTGIIILEYTSIFVLIGYEVLYKTRHHHSPFFKFIEHRV